MKSILKKDYLLILVLSVLCFFTIKQIIPNAIYLILAILLGIYFFPLKLIINSDFINKTESSKILFIALNMLASIIIVLSSLLFYVDANSIFSVIVSYSGIAVFLLLIYSYLKNKNKYFIYLSLSILWLNAGILAI